MNRFSISHLVMSESLTITLAGKSSVLESNFLPPIELYPNKKYGIGVVELLTYNSIPNIKPGCNKFYVSNWDPIVLPTGSYEISDLNVLLTSLLQKTNNKFSLQINRNSLHTLIDCDLPINFEKEDSIGPLLGFKSKVLTPGNLHTSDYIANIFNSSVVRVDCDLARGAYLNGKPTHTVHEFFPNVAAGYKIIELPTPIIYLPLSRNLIDRIVVKIIDQNNEIVNFRGEDIVIRLHIKQFNGD